MKYLVAGLGNIGPDYDDTRHNVGFMLADELSVMHSCAWELKRHALVTDFKYRGRQVYMIKPTTFMNLSGKAVNYWLKELGVDKKNLLVIMDDVALPFGSFRLRGKGSSAGHNGLKDIESYIGQDYPRLRFGIGDDYRRGQQADYVLSPFSSKESEDLPSCLVKGMDMVHSFVFRGLGPTMTEFND